VTTPDAGSPVDRPRRPHPDPLVMSPAEKIAAEWEARHDVAARGHHPSPDAVQHYLAEARTRGMVAEPARRGPTPPPAAPPAPTPAGRRSRPWWRFWQRG
jgi:hypothetical protein